MIKQFQDPDRQYSSLAFWFLNGKLEEDKLRRQIREMADKGVYGGFMHPRAYLETPYLEEEWWEAIHTCVDEAKKTGFNAWLYDEYAWPSGTAGSTFEYGFQKPSRILEKGKKYMAKGLKVQVFSSKAEMRDISSEGDTLLYALEKNGLFYGFYCHIYPKAVDYLNPEAIREFIKLTHEEYRNHFGEEFGRQIPGIFFDEIFMAGNPIPWTERLPEAFYERFGYRLEQEMVSLIAGEGEHERSVRKDYYECIAFLYEEAFFRQISDWCQKNDLMLIGHTEEFLWEQPKRQGNYFNTIRHLMIPGSDCHDYRYRYPRKITFCEPKYAVSVARAYNKKRSMSEALGGAGWNCTLEEMKRGINTLAAMGTSMFVLHGFYYECDHQGSQSDWPASFFYQNEYWKDFKIFADYMRRISFMNTVGRAVVKYGIFYPIEWMSECMVNGQEDEEGMAGSQAFHEVLNEMIEQQMDVDMIDSYCILKAVIQNGELCIGQQQIQLLLYPSGAGMDRELEEKLREWQAAGGKIILYHTGTTANQIQSFPANKRCQPCEAAEAAKELTEPDIRIIWGCRDEIYVNHRQAAGCHYFFVCNSSKEKRDLVMELDVNKAERVYRLNIETGDITVLPFMEARSRRGEGKKEENGRKKGRVRVVLEASEAIYLFCTDEEIPDAETMPEDCSYEEIHITGKWDFLPLKADAQTGILEVPLTYFSTDLREGGQEIWIRDWERHDGKRSDRASQWEAFWITRRPSWNDQLDAENLYFYKDIVIQGSIQKARICLTAIDSYKLYINGSLAAERRSEGMPDTIDVKKYLKPGENRIAVSVKNHHPMQEVNICSAKELPVDRLISLLLQGEIVTEEEEQILISDSSWAVTDQYTEGWNRRDVCHEVHKYDILKVNNFNHTSAGHSWIKAWERGRPPLLPWGDLPLFGQDTPYPYYKYYETELPAGVRRIQKPDISGESQSFLDGVPFD